MSPAAAPQSPAPYDSLGFPLETAPISTIDHLDAVNHIWDVIDRAKALLGTLHYRLRNDRSMLSDEVELLVGMALQQLSDANGESFDALEEFGRDAHNAASNARAGQKAMSKVVLAFENATWDDLQLDEANLCARDIWDVKALIPEGAFAMYWESFCDVLNRRGFRVDIKPGVDNQSYVEVSDAATRKMVGKVVKATQKAIAEAEQEHAKKPVRHRR